MFFDLLADDSKAEGADEIEHMTVECRRELGVGEGHEKERRGWLSANYASSKYPLVISLERAETRALDDELSPAMMKLVYEALLKEYSSYNDRDITIEGVTATGSIWQFKLLNGYDSHWSWSPLRTVREDKPTKFSWF